MAYEVAAVGPVAEIAAAIYPVDLAVAGGGVSPLGFSAREVAERSWRAAPLRR